MELFITIFAGVLIVLMCIGIYIVNSAEQKERYKNLQTERDKKHERE